MLGDDLRDLNKAWQELKDVTRDEVVKEVAKMSEDTGRAITGFLLVVLFAVAMYQAAFAPCTYDPWVGNGALQQVALFKALMGG